MAGDDALIAIDPALMEAVAREALDEPMSLPAQLEETVERDELRAWFEREMGSTEMKAQTIVRRQK